MKDKSLLDNDEQLIRIGYMMEQVYSNTYKFEKFFIWR